MNMKALKEVSLSENSSFRIGGLTKNFFEPVNQGEFLQSLEFCKINDHQPVIIGYGTNTLFPDYPDRNQWFISLKKMSGFYTNSNSRYPQSISLLAGTPLSVLAIIGSLVGVDLGFTYLLPGSIGGAVYMNARYMNEEISDIISNVYYVDSLKPEEGIKSIVARDCEFSYKYSVFQRSSKIIIAADISGVTIPDNDLSYNEATRDIMEDIRCNTLKICDIAKFSRVFIKYADRFSNYNSQKTFHEIFAYRNKYHHFDYPSAGSVFKNSRYLGQPIGQIIDQLGLKGKVCGNAMISPYHGNIIINNGNAKAKDVLLLIDEMKDKIFTEHNYEAELELKIIS